MLLYLFIQPSGGKDYLGTSRKPIVARPATLAMPHDDSRGHVDTSVLGDSFHTKTLPVRVLIYDNY